MQKLNARILKFGKQEHLFALQKYGEVYLNPLRYFWNMEVPNDHQFDKFDSILDRRNIKPGPIDWINDDGSISKKFVTKGELVVYPNNPDKICLFCGYAYVTENKQPSDVDTRMSNFGDTILVINDPKEFIERAKNEFEKEKYHMKCQLISYVPDEYFGKMNEFTKFSKFSYQYEWRMVCYNGPGEVFKIRIGDITDISRITSHEEFMNPKSNS